MWIGNTANLLPILGKTIIAFVALVVLSRIFGKRALTRLTTVDLALGLTAGPILASMIMNPQTSIVDGLGAIGVLFLVDWLSGRLVARWPAFRELVRVKPTLLAYEGQYQRAGMRRQNLTEADIMEALRMHGLYDIAQARAVILEPEGRISVIVADGTAASMALDRAGLTVPQAEGKG